MFIGHIHVGVVCCCCLLVVGCWLFSSITRVHYWSNWLYLWVLPCHSCGLWVCARRIHSDIHTCSFRHLFTLCYVHTTVSLSLCSVLRPSVELLLSSPYLDYPTFVIAIVITVFIVHSFVFVTLVYELRRISQMSTPGHRIWFHPMVMVGCSSVVLVHSVHARRVPRCHRTKTYKERKRGPLLFFIQWPSSSDITSHIAIYPSSHLQPQPFFALSSYLEGTLSTTTQPNDLVFLPSSLPTSDSVFSIRHCAFPTLTSLARPPKHSLAATRTLHWHHITHHTSHITQRGKALNGANNDLPPVLDNKTYPHTQRTPQSEGKILAQDTDPSPQHQHCPPTRHLITQSKSSQRYLVYP